MHPCIHTYMDAHTQLKHTHTQTHNTHICTLIISNDHWAISLVVPGLSSKWTIDRDLCVVGSQPVSMSIIVGEQATLRPRSNINCTCNIHILKLSILKYTYATPTFITEVLHLVTHVQLF